MGSQCFSSSTNSHSTSNNSSSSSSLLGAGSSSISAKPPHPRPPPLSSRQLSRMMSAGVLSVLLLCTLYFTVISTHQTMFSHHVPANLTQSLPSAIIFGVRKGGTRALLEFLSLHPQLATAHDEVHFFDRDEQYERGLDWYREQMPWALPGQITLEKTPAYFITPEAPMRIYFMNPRTKLILIVRDPVTRVLSDYTQILSSRRAQNLTFKQFEDLVTDPLTLGVNLGYKAIQISIYHKHYRRWLTRFPPEQIHIVDGDKLIKHPASELQKVEDFLALRHYLTDDRFYFNKTKGFYCMKKKSSLERCLGASKGRPHPKIDEEVILKLRKFYAPLNQEFFNITGRTFNWPSH